jgi:hypothetical protein
VKYITILQVPVKNEDPNFGEILFSDQIIFIVIAVSKHIPAGRQINESN